MQDLPRNTVTASLNDEDDIVMMCCLDTGRFYGIADGTEWMLMGIDEALICAPKDARAFMRGYLACFYQFAQNDLADQARIDEAILAAVPAVGGVM